DLLTTTDEQWDEELYYYQEASGGCVVHDVDAAAAVPSWSLVFLVEEDYDDEDAHTDSGVDKRTVLRLDHRIAPVKAAVLPLSRNEKLSPVAKDLAAKLRKHWNVEFDDAGAIGRRYRRQDEVGTPYCVTVDFDSLDDQAVTIRERDTMSQERVPLDQVESYLAARLIGA